MSLAVIAKVFRFISTGLSKKTMIRNALKDIMKAAPCLNFQEMTLSTVPKDYVAVVSRGG